MFYYWGASSASAASFFTAFDYIYSQTNKGLLKKLFYAFLVVTVINLLCWCFYKNLTVFICAVLYIILFFFYELLLVIR